MHMSKNRSQHSDWKQTLLLDEKKKKSQIETQPPVQTNTLGWGDQRVDNPRLDDDDAMVTNLSLNGINY